MLILGIYLYVTAVGFVAAGILASFVQLLSGEPMRFELESQSILASIGGVLIRALAGPAILMRNAWRDLRFKRDRKHGSASRLQSPLFGAFGSGPSWLRC